MSNPQHRADSSVWGPLLRSGRSRTIPLHIAELELPTAPVVRQALTQLVESGRFGYTEPFEDFAEITAAWCKRRHGWDLDRSLVVHVPRVVQLLPMLAHDFFPGSPRTLVLAPLYSPTVEVLERNGCEIVRFPLVETRMRWQIDFAALEQELDGGVEMLLLCSPHNPTGTTWSRSELAELSRICAGRGILVVADEVHADLVHSCRFVPFGDAAVSDARWLSCLSPGKAFNLAGLETTAVVCSDPELAARLRVSLRKHGFHNANAFGLAALKAAWSQGDAWLDELHTLLRANQALALEAMRSRLPGLRPVPGDSTYLLWIDASVVGGREAISEWFIERADVVPGFGADFGPGYDSWIRLNLGLPPELLREALERIITAAPPAATCARRAELAVRTPRTHAERSEAHVQETEN